LAGRTPLRASSSVDLPAPEQYLPLCHRFGEVQAVDTDRPVLGPLDQLSVLIDEVISAKGERRPGRDCRRAAQLLPIDEGAIGAIQIGDPQCAVLLEFEAGVITGDLWVIEGQAIARITPDCHHRLGAEIEDVGDRARRRFLQGDTDHRAGVLLVPPGDMIAQLHDQGEVADLDQVAIAQLSPTHPLPVDEGAVGAAGIV
jgi:hypothetical protein